MIVEKIAEATVSLVCKGNGITEIDFLNENRKTSGVFTPTSFEANNDYSNPGIITPEHLEAAGVGACFIRALQVACEENNVDTSREMMVSSHIVFGKTKDGAYTSEVEMSVQLADMPREDAIHIVERARELCPPLDAELKRMAVGIRLDNRT